MAVYQFLFHNTLGAIQLKKTLQQKLIPFTLMDAPRELTSSCGLSIRFQWDQNIEAFIVPQQTQSIYCWLDDNYQLYWQDNQ